MRITVDRFDPDKIARNETLFHIANGYIGVRGCFEEGVPDGVQSIRGTYVNGFYDVKPVHYAERLYGFPEESECMVNAIDMQTIRLTINGAPFSMFRGRIDAFSQVLDMDAGTYTRAVDWTAPDGTTIRVHIRRLASLVERSMFLIEYRVIALRGACALALESTANGDVVNFADPNDPRMSAESGKHLITRAVRATDMGAVLVAEAPGSGLTMAAGMAHALSTDWPCENESTDTGASVRYQGTLAPGASVVLTKYCVYADARRVADPAQAVQNTLERVRQTPFDEWARLQKTELDAFWRRARITIDGDDKLMDSLNYNIYSLMQSASCDAYANVAAKGLSGEGYEGHYFWDTEIYIFPFFLLTDTRRAKNLLDFRHALLPAAQKHARTMGHTRGALYPWRTIAGRECSSYYPSGSAQYHLSGDVAHSFLQYWYATDDLAYMAEKGWPVLAETARMWLDAGHYVDGQFHIDDVTGPDEYTCVVNNNYYTNCCAKENLLGARALALALQDAGYAIDTDAAELDAFKRAGEHMVLPYDEKLGIYAQDDSFLRKPELDLSAIPRENFPLLMHYHPLFLYRHQVLKQADAVLAHYLFADDVADDDMRHTYAYYEARTTHDSSLSPCAYAIVAAQLGDMPKSETYFRQTAELDLTDAHHNTKDGIHTASMGGAYLTVVMGFAGLRIRPDGLALNPRIPPGIDGYRFRFVYRSRTIELAVDHSGHRLRLLDGAPVTVSVLNKATRLE